MGRVASKRRIKQCDPFHKGKGKSMLKSKESKYDLPPSESKSKRKKKKKALSQQSIDAEVFGRVAVATSKVPKLESRKDNESYRQFCKRVHQDARTAIYEETKKNTNVYQKRQRFFEEKKRKKKREKMSEQEKYELDYLQKGEKEKNFQGTERISFGERVDAPPVLPCLKGFNKRLKNEKYFRKIKTR